jgi:hypothetical protein
LTCKRTHFLKVCFCWFYSVCSGKDPSLYTPCDKPKSDAKCIIDDRRFSKASIDVTTNCRENGIEAGTSYNATEMTALLPHKKGGSGGGGGGIIAYTTSTILGAGSPVTATGGSLVARPVSRSSSAEQILVSGAGGAGCGNTSSINSSSISSSSSSSSSGTILVNRSAHSNSTATSYQLGVTANGTSSSSSTIAVGGGIGGDKDDTEAAAGKLAQGYSKAEITARTPWRLFASHPVVLALILNSFCYVSGCFVSSIQFRLCT